MRTQAPTEAAALAENRMVDDCCGHTHTKAQTREIEKGQTIGRSHFLTARNLFVSARESDNSNDNQDDDDVEQFPLICKF